MSNCKMFSFLESIQNDLQKVNSDGLIHSEGYFYVNDSELEDDVSSSDFSESYSSDSWKMSSDEKNTTKIKAPENFFLNF